MKAFGICLLAFFGFFVLLGSLSGRQAAISTSAASAWDGMRDEAIARMSIKKLEWRKGGFGSIMVVNELTVFNGSKYRVNDLQLSCSLTAESGTVVGRPSTTVYVSLAPKQTKLVRGLNMGFTDEQADGASCWISGVGDVSLIN